jgi:hypothetical protein
MKRLGTAATFSLALLAFFALARPAAAAEFVVFKGTLDGDVTHTPVNDHTDFVVVQGTGTATRLGQFEVTAAHFVNTVARTAAGTYVFTAANGDMLTADFTGQASLTTTPGVLHVVETATITGGTGRFEGATGEFVVDRLFDRVAGTTTGTFEGTISTVGASRD